MLLWFQWKLGSHIGKIIIDASKILEFSMHFSVRYRMILISLILCTLLAISTIRYTSMLRHKNWHFSTYDC